MDVTPRQLELKGFRVSPPDSACLWSAPSAGPQRLFVVDGSLQLVRGSPAKASAPFQARKPLALTAGSWEGRQVPNIYTHTPGATCRPECKAFVRLYWTLFNRRRRSVGPHVAFFVRHCVLHLTSRLRAVQQVTRLPPSRTFVLFAPVADLWSSHLFRSEDVHWRDFDAVPRDPVWVWTLPSGTCLSDSFEQFICTIVEFDRQSTEALRQGFSCRILSRFFSHSSIRR